ncbi:amino acid permease/ SLC12A domain-containing protein [Talaromyces proteolyticus]|uniref:Amino acid permease/ SLC12A domain-containing protein n=1 Tax=Talaromyces proteolyticus TaxID=1131652 RepID=A0AAD4Q161_9EURO|nr:amino acid permease/ SLC12A domain-containing protein [Talaromyces proteolyticus]KAH8701944.1 amino acid permease/ SLC12A domain-containing protein [Talaromyces proteolyticus]
MSSLSGHDLPSPEEVIPGDCKDEEKAMVTELGSRSELIANGYYEERQAFRQGLRERHIQMIALAGTIGTGLFLSSGRAIANSGPLGSFLGYSIVGLSVSSIMFAIGELGALVPLNGGIVRYSEYFFDPALSFANGWNLVYSYLVSIPAEVTAAAVLIEFWITINNAVWITIFGVLMTATAVLLVRVYGELEFGFSMLKIMLVIGINIMALVITCGGGPNHESIGFQYWKSPGPFVQYLGIKGSLGRFLGFWTTMNNAVYSYSGIEVITAAAAETRNPRRAIPQAARRIFIRIILFYVITIFMVGLVVPSNDPSLLRSTGTASQSPFVIAATRAGIKVVPSIINAVILTSAWSSGNSNMLSGSRVLYGLAVHGHAPKVFRRINRFGVPYVSVALFSVFICLGYMTISSTASTVFNWLQDLVSVSTIINWLSICVVYLRFYYGCKKQNIDRHRDLPYAAPWQPYATWATLILYIVLLLTGGYSTFMRGKWSNETFVSSYINIPIILLLYFGFKLWKKSKIVPLDELPIRQFIEIYQRNPEPAPKPKRGLHRLNILWS